MPKTPFHIHYADTHTHTHTHTERERLHIKTISHRYNNHICQILSQTSNVNNIKLTTIAIFTYCCIVNQLEILNCSNIIYVMLSASTNIRQLLARVVRGLVVRHLTLLSPYLVDSKMSVNVSRYNGSRRSAQICKRV